VDVEVCARCMGMWFDAGELGQSAGVHFVDGATPERMTKARRTEYRCPWCGVFLFERELHARSGVVVEQCPKCSGLFFDHGEYSRARQYLQSRQSEKAAAEHSHDLPDVVDEDSPLLIMFQYLTGLPLELNVTQRLFSPVVASLILINVVVLVLAYIYGFTEWIDELALVPAEIVAGERLYTFVTAMFMHGGVFHLLGNMYFLFITGDNVEERMGWHWFLGLYLIAGFVANAAHILGTSHSFIPTVGASGAISGVLGAYMVLFPHHRFLLRWFFFWRGPTRLELPAWAYLGFWILLQLFYVGLDMPGVAWWAHIGGFAFGVLAAVLWRILERSRVEERSPR